MAARSAEEFPSRQYAYSRVEVAAGLEAGLTLPEMNFERGAVYRFVLGRDPAPQKLDGRISSSGRSRTRLRGSCSTRASGPRRSEPCSAS